MTRLKFPNSMFLGLGLFVIAGALAWAGDIWTTELCVAGWGRQAEGVITEKRIIRGKSVSYRVDYTFPYVSGPTAAAEAVSSREIVSRSTFDRVVEGGRVAVTYCAWSKARHFVDRDKQHHNIFAALLMACMFSIGLGFSIWRARRDEELDRRSVEVVDRDWADPLANHVPGSRR